MSRNKKSAIIPVREPNGRLQRSTVEAIDAVSPTEIRRMREAAVLGLRDGEWGTELGRLYLLGDVDGPQYGAGKRWQKLVAGYHQAIGAKPHPKSMSFERRDGSLEPDPESEKGKRQTAIDRALVADMREAHAVLIGAGMLAERAVRAVCEENDASVGIFGINNLCRGLAWLSLYWGLTQQPKQSNVGKVK